MRVVGPHHQPKAGAGAQGEEDPRHSLLAVERIVGELAVPAPHVPREVETRPAEIEAGGNASPLVGVVPTLDVQSSSLPRAALPSAGNYLHHTAYRVAAVERTEGSADDLHAVDAVERHELPVGAAEEGIVQGNAIPQQQGLIRVGAAGEEGRLLAGRTRLDDREAGNGIEEGCQIVALPGRDLLAVDDGDGSRHVGAHFSVRGSGDHDVLTEDGNRNRGRPLGYDRPSTPEDTGGQDQ